ncbi:MAG: L,D-transpeptidase family protein [Streptosporangiales bacterium]|nr:L,D-transpeptidase family protein [Streptosporangiales bacterium]
MPRSGDRLKTRLNRSSLATGVVGHACARSRVSRIAAVAAAAILTATALAGCGSDDGKSAEPKNASTTAKASAKAKPKKIKTSSTFTTIAGLPRDNSMKETDGKVVHPKKKTKIYDNPRGSVVARLPVKELGNLTWVPVVDERSGWLRILLPSKPNGSTGWIKSTNQLQVARSMHVIKIDVAARTLTLLKNGSEVGSWDVAVGTKKTPTPRVRTYLMASIIDQKQRKYTPIVLPLGAHSDTLDTFGGGPGTVAIHGWSTDSSVFGQAVSNGCVRVPADALTELRSVPLGSLVLIR